MSKYDEIINLEHFDPVNYPRMSMENRAAQFSPFAALTGYSESIKETARITKNEINLSDDVKTEIDMKLQLIDLHIKDKLEVTIVYFVKDKKKPGGDYFHYTGVVRRIDKVNGKIIFFDKTVISLNDIIDIKTDFIMKY